MHIKPRFACAFAMILALACSSQVAHTESPQSGRRARVLVTQNIDEAKLVMLMGNVRPEASAVNDRGAVPEDFAMEHMLLQLQRPPELEKELQQFIDELHDPQSPNFHKWLTAQQFGERFGVAQQDVDSVTRWLESFGFKVNYVYPSFTLIDFSGNASQVRAAFHTEIHYLDVQGARHVANMSKPQIPAALAPAVVGIVFLHDFKPRGAHKMRVPSAAFTFPGKSGGTEYAMVPGDLATIYNLNPLFNSGVSGQGQTIALIKNTDLFSTSDWSTFRSTFGLASFSGSLSTVHPGNCADPGLVGGNEGEAILDAEWATAAAPSAQISEIFAAFSTYDVKVLPDCELQVGWASLLLAFPSIRSVCDSALLRFAVRCKSSGMFTQRQEQPSESDAVLVFTTQRRSKPVSRYPFIFEM